MLCSPRLMADFMASLGEHQAGKTERLRLRQQEQGRRLCSVCPSLKDCRRQATDGRLPNTPGMVAGLLRREREQIMHGAP